MNGHTPVTDISIIVPFVTFSNSLSKLISKSTSSDLSSVNRSRGELIRTSEARIFVLGTNFVDSDMFSA